MTTVFFVVSTLQIKTLGCFFLLCFGVLFAPVVTLCSLLPHHYFCQHLLISHLILVTALISLPFFFHHECCDEAAFLVVAFTPLAWFSQLVGICE